MPYGAQARKALEIVKGLDMEVIAPSHGVIWTEHIGDILEKYEEYAQEFERITDYQKNQLGVLVNEVDEQLFYGKLRKISSKMKELESMLKIYEDDSQALLAKLKNY